jgi:hypothetical protein
MRTFEDFCYLGYDTVQSVGSQPMFQKNMSHPYSGLKNKQRRNQHEVCNKQCLYLLPVNLEDEGIFLRNIG